MTMCERRFSVDALTMVSAVSVSVLLAQPCEASDDDRATAQDAPTPVVMIAENGARVPTPEIDTLTCDEMNRTLMNISATGYRGVEVVSEEHPDYQIFDYENRLATAHYEDCQVGVVDFTAPRSVFSQGFN
jgi:hypothetical protein